MAFLGVDIGFGFTKATDGGERVIFKSILGEATENIFQSEFATTSRMENLHVTMDDRSYFVGDYAEQQSRIRYFTLDQETLFRDMAKVLALTACGLFSTDEHTIDLVTGLPIRYFAQLREPLTKMLRGSHMVQYRTAKGQVLNRMVIINRIKVLPQPFGTLVNMLIDDRGQFVMPELSRQKVGIVDVGFRTTDIIISDRLSYIERGSKTSDAGISRAYSFIAEKLFDEIGVHIELYRLYEAVQVGTIKVRGREYDLSDLRQTAFRYLANIIAGDITRFWTEDWDMDYIVLTGGGGRDIHDFLVPLLGGEVRLLNESGDPRLNNVLGYLKYARQAGLREQQAQEQQPAPQGDRPNTNNSISAA